MTESTGTGDDIQASGRISGRKVVALMLGFGVVMVAALWLYWELHTRPFRPLQTAIAAEFPDSRPGVIGALEPVRRKTIIFSSEGERAAAWSATSFMLTTCPRR